MNDFDEKLTSAEVAMLWSTYINDSAAICVFEHFIHTAEDEEVRTEVEYALQVSRNHIKSLTTLFQKEKFPMPYGFNVEADLNKEAPRLFSDHFYLFFLRNTAQGGLADYAAAVGVVTRDDMLDFFSDALVEAKNLMKRVTKVLVKKGLPVKPPFFQGAEPANYVEKESYLRGWFGHRRTLSVNELSHLYINGYHHALWKGLAIGFSQVAEDREVRQFFKKGEGIAGSQLNALNAVIQASKQPSPVTWDAEVLDSTTAPYSDRLMMYLNCAIAAIGISFLGSSLSQALRHDIALQYVRMVGEVGTYVEDGASIMIKNGWFEKPPQTIDHDSLSVQ